MYGWIPAGYFPEHISTIPMGEPDKGPEVHDLVFCTICGCTYLDYCKTTPGHPVVPFEEVRKPP